MQSARKRQFAALAAIAGALNFGGLASAQTLRPATLTPDPTSVEAGLWGAADRGGP